jgi:hypothetical protein
MVKATKMLKKGSRMGLCKNNIATTSGQREARESCNMPTGRMFLWME